MAIYDPTNYPNGINADAMAFGSDKIAGHAVIAVGAEAANVINVTVQLQDGIGNDLAVASVIDWYLADDAAGLDRSTTAPDGGVAIGTDGSISEYVANLAGSATSEADGDIDLDITETGVATWYLVIVLPFGKPIVSAAITFA